MSILRIPLVVFMTFLLISCSNTPNVTFNKNAFQGQKLPFKVAVVMDKNLKNRIHETYISTQCVYTNYASVSITFGKETKKKDDDVGTKIIAGRLYAANEVGNASEKLFAEGLPYLFERVDVYEDAYSIKNKEDYDFILYPAIKIDTNHDENAARERKIRTVYNASVKANVLDVKPYRMTIGSSAELELGIVDAKSDSTVQVFKGSGSSRGNWTTDDHRCTDKDNLTTALGIQYQDPIGEAMSAAFENLLMAINNGKTTLVKSKTPPSELTMTVLFSDDKGSNPNNILDAGENAEIVVNVKNNGTGTAFDSKLEVVSDNPKIIMMDREIKVGDIQAGETKEIKVNLRAALDTGMGKASFKLALKESRGYDAEKVTIDVPTVNEKIMPSDIAVTARFSDSNGYTPNSILDAGENAEIVISVKNNGKGTGFETSLVAVSDNPKIILDREIKVGDIQAGETKEIKIKLDARLDIDTGKESFQLTLRERRGYDAKKVIINVPTAKLERPQLEIISTEINDGDTGLAKGNGNGIPENGETVELTAFIKNGGAGKAIGVNLTGSAENSGIRWVRDSLLVGTIPQGEIVKAKIGFSIPRNFDAKEIAADLKVTDVRGVSNAEKRVELSYAKRSPNIQYTLRILSRDKEVNKITNGENYEVEFTIDNKGQIPARDVVLSLTSDRSVNLSRSGIDLGEIKEQSSVSGQRFTLSIPRTFTGVKLPLNLEIAQSDFSPVKDSIQIPVDVKSPKLRYMPNLLSKSGGSSLEQGESAVLEIQVLNEGNLPAEDVKVKIESKDENLKISGQTEVVIGKIPANSKSETIKFQISTFRRIKIGDTYLGINITQSDFSSVVPQQYALNIKEEGAVVVDVASEDRGKDATVVGKKSTTIINIKTAQNLELTSDDSIPLAFEVIDSRNIEKIKIEVNGVTIPLDEKAGLTLQPSKKKEIMKNIPLKEGENKIVITAWNTDNLVSIKKINVTRVGEEDIDVPPVTGLNNNNGFAVVIGISKYENKDIPSVNYARRDAAVVKDYLIKTLGFKETNIKEFYDEQATFTKLTSYFKTHLKNRVQPGISDVFIFYSGHGVPEGNEAYFAPYDLDPGDIKNTGYAVKELYAQLNDIRAKGITVAIDACFSGTSDNGVPIIKSASPVFFEISNPLLKAKNSVVFTSSTAKQISSWYDKKQHGLFTYYFLQGLKGMADINKDGEITAGELEKHILKNVSEQARILRSREQTPEVTGFKDKVLIRYK